MPERRSRVDARLIVAWIIPGCYYVPRGRPVEWVEEVALGRSTRRCVDDAMNL